MRRCVVTYPFAGNGPWNYVYEEPPKGVKQLRHYGVFLEEDDVHWIVASDIAVLEDGTEQPTHRQHFQKSFCTIEIEP